MVGCLVGQEIAAFWVELLVGPWAMVKEVIDEVKNTIEKKHIKERFIFIFLDGVGRILIEMTVFILIKSNQLRQVQLGSDHLF